MGVSFSSADGTHGGLCAFFNMRLATQMVCLSSVKEVFSFQQMLLISSLPSWNDSVFFKACWAPLQCI